MMNVSGLGISVPLKIVNVSLFLNCRSLGIGLLDRGVHIGIRMRRDAGMSDFTIRFGPGGSRRPHRDWGPAKDEVKRFVHYLESCVHIVISVPRNEIDVMNVCSFSES